MRLIETYDESSTLNVVGQSFPRICVAEDDDGIRYLLMDAEVTTVSANVWQQAYSAGTSALVRVTPTGWRVLTAEQFVEVRTENVRQRRFEVPDATWRPVAAGAAYVDMLGTPPPLLTERFVHLHTHSEYSQLDGLTRIPEMVQQVVADQQTAVAVTDHGVCAGHPELQAECDKVGIKPIFGIEAYWVEDRLVKTSENRAYHHLVLLAENEIGLRNLWAASTESFRDGFYYYPRMDWGTLQRHAEGVICLTGCLKGPLGDLLRSGKEVAARQRLARFMDIFADRLYIELQGNQDMVEQRQLNPLLIGLARELSVPLVATVDSHYPTAADRPAHKAWIALQTQKDIGDESELFRIDNHLYIQSEAVVRERMAYLGSDVVEEGIRNSALIASRCNARVVGSQHAPTYSKVGGVRSDEDRLRELCASNWQKTKAKREPDEIYQQRFDREMRLLVEKEFCGYFLLVADYCRAAKEGRVRPDGRPVLVGPGRGSGGGSLVAYLAGITDIDPVDSDLLFERFLTEGRKGLPDFDVDFPASQKENMLRYVRQRWGEDHVVTVGTHLKLKNKGIIRDLGRAMKSTLPPSWFVDGPKIAEIIDNAEASTAGLGLTWDELWAQEAETLQPYVELYPELFKMAASLVARVKTYGKHAAGVVISTEEPLIDRYPLRGGDEGEGQMVTQFSMEALEMLGLVKCDLLTLRTLDTIQEALDLVRDQKGQEVDVYSWREEYEDPQIWQEISEAKTLGIFQIETTSGTKLTRQFQPQSLSELADMITLVRPGPMRSGLTATYLKRRAGKEEVTFPDPRLAQVLAKTHGTILYQEDIMAACMLLAGYSSNEADAVRKILGKKQVEKIAEEGKRFVSRCVENGMAAEQANALWQQMAEFAKYSFNRAHAFAYAILAHWTAWFKFHYPVQFLAAALSTVDKDRIPDFIKEARRMGYAVKPPDINESKLGFTGTGLAVRYGLHSIKGLGPGTAEKIIEGQPYISWEDFQERKPAACNAGHVLTLARVGAFDQLVQNRRGLEELLEATKQKLHERCLYWVDGFPGPNDLPCTFDWSSEPRSIGRTGALKPAKPLPKRCSKACRQYVQVDMPDYFSVVTPYTPEQIREIEYDLLGVYLSSTPFDRLPDEQHSVLLRQLDALLDPAVMPRDPLVIAGILGSIRPRRDRNGQMMAFLTFITERDDIDVVCFASKYTKHEKELVKGQLYLLEVRKNDRGLSLYGLAPALVKEH